MSIRSEVVENGEKKRGEHFPKLMLDGTDGQIVLVLGNHECEGLVKTIALTKSENFSIGKEMNLSLDRLYDFTGTLQLSNE